MTFRVRLAYVLARDRATGLAASAALGHGHRPRTVVVRVTVLTFTGTDFVIVEFPVRIRTGTRTVLVLRDTRVVRMGLIARLLIRREIKNDSVKLAPRMEGAVSLS